MSQRQRPLVLPDEFELSYYRLEHDDLRNFSDNELFSHYEMHGQKEGRGTSSGSSRDTFLKIIPNTVSVLEIGPFCNPACTGKNVSYFDVLDSAGLRERARDHSLDTSRCPETIHYVSATGDLTVVDDRFDIAFSSHCIEHQPNLLKNLRDVSNILNDGGYYFLIIPDKRYCFDYFIPESSIAGVIDADIRNRILHDPGSIIEHRLLTTHNDPLRHWQGDHELRNVDNDPGLIAGAIAEAKRYSEGYIDVHAWQFTPESFRSILDLLFAAELCPLRQERVYLTRYGSMEFCAILCKQ